MSAILFDLDSAPQTAPAVAVAASPATNTGRRFPIGARFPRRTAEQELAYLISDAHSTGTRPVFPVGARFPRLDEAAAVAFLADLRTAPAGTARTSRRSLPIGARFPRLAA